MHLLPQSGLGLICGLAVAAFTSAASAQLTPAPADDPLGQLRPAPDVGGNSNDGLIGTLPAADFGRVGNNPPPDNPDLDFDNIGSLFPLCGFGLLFGLGGALVLGRLLRSVLYVAAGDPVSYILGVVILLGAAALASLVPARRATRVDPIVALRAG